LVTKEQAILGLTVTVLCAVGLWKDRWFLANTKKGRRLSRWLGETRGLWVLRSLLVLGAAFGVLLAMNMIRPVRW